MQATGGTGEIGKGSGMERDLLFLSRGGRIAKRKAGLLCVPCQERVVGWFLIKWVLGFAAKIAVA